MSSTFNQCEIYGVCTDFGAFICFELGGVNPVACPTLDKFKLLVEAGLALLINFVSD